MKKPYLIVLYIVVCACLIFIGSRIFSTFFDTGVKSLRTLAADAGMEEGAYYPLRAVAGVQLGHIVVTYPVDEATGRCRPKFRNLACPNPKADPELLKEQQAAIQEELHQHVLALRSGADSDGSGFVATEEGARFRELFEFGHLVANCSERSGPSAEETYRNLKDYRELVASYPSEIRAYFPPVGDRSSKPRSVRQRIDADLADGKPIVVHVVVALCDNRYQGIVPVPENIGNGQNPETNLYWGAMYGVRTFFDRSDSWETIASRKPDDERILDRVVFAGKVARGERNVPVHVVADAWDGKYIKGATAAFLEMAATGKPHLVAYVGHDGLMDFSLPAPEPVAGSPPSETLVLACASKQYFKSHLEAAGSQPLLLTTGLMAPEAYTLDAAIRTWAGGGSTDAVRESAAQAYHQYQNCGLKAAERLFWTGP